jgi:hypothetical protein
MNHPTGTFNGVEITDCGFGESGDAGTPHIFVIFRTEHKEITGYFWLTDKSAKYTQEKLLNMGVPADMPWDEVVTGITDGTLLIGRTVQITVESEEWNGDTRSQVKGVRPDGFVGGPKRSSTAASSAKKFGALWRKTGKETTVSAPAPASDAHVDPEEDDVPF